MVLLLAEGERMKSRGGLTASSALITVSLALVLAAPLLSQVTLTVDATMDIYRAGAFNDGSDGVTPVRLQLSGALLSRL